MVAVHRVDAFRDPGGLGHRNVPDCRRKSQCLRITPVAAGSGKPGGEGPQRRMGDRALTLPGGTMNRHSLVSEVISAK